MISEYWKMSKSAQTVAYRSTCYVIIKWTLVVLAVLNIANSVWVGIYMNNRIERFNTIMSERRPTKYERYYNHNVKKNLEIWKGVIIAALVIADSTCILGIYGTIRENYCICMMFGIFMLGYAVFTAAVGHTRGSISAWLLSFITGLIACLFCHQIRIEIFHPLMYSLPVESP